MKILRNISLLLALATVFAFSASGQTTLTSPDGTRVDIEGQNGKVVVLAIGASWLPLSAKQAEFTNALAKKYAGKQVAFYFVSIDSMNAKSKNFASNEAVAKFAMDNKLTVTVLRDPDGAATLKRYSVEQVPSFVILDRTGKLAGEPFGGIDPKFDVTVPLSKRIDQLL